MSEDVTTVCASCDAYEAAPEQLSLLMTWRLHLPEIFQGWIVIRAHCVARVPSLMRDCFVLSLLPALPWLMPLSPLAWV